jgi:predicted phosphodiesterase
MGDLIDGIVRQDMRRFTGNVTTSELNDMLDSALNQQRRMVVDLFSPLADEKRILGALEGNHEFEVKKHHSFDIQADICELLNIPNLGYSCFYDLILTKKRCKEVKKVTMYCSHGWGAGRRKGSSINKLEDLVRNYDAEIYLSGHDHMKMGSRHVKLYKAGSRIAHKPVILARTGSFKKAVVPNDISWEETRGFPPSDIGCVKITLDFKSYSTGFRDLDAHISE